MTPEWFNVFLEMSRFFGYTQITMLVMSHVSFFIMTCFSPNHSGGLISYNPHFCAGKGKHSLACWFEASDKGYSQSCMFEAFDKVYSCSEICWVPGRQLYSFFLLATRNILWLLLVQRSSSAISLGFQLYFFHLFCETSHFQSTNAHGTYM